MSSKRRGFMMYEAIIGISVLCLTIQLCMGMLQNCQQQMNLEQARLTSIKDYFDRQTAKPKQENKKRLKKQMKIYRQKRDSRT